MTTEIIIDFAAHLDAMVSRGESLADYPTDGLNRDRVKMLRRAQAGLSAKPSSTPVVAAPVAKRAPRKARRSSLACGCYECRRGCESACLREGN